MMSMGLCVRNVSSKFRLPETWLHPYNHENLSSDLPLNASISSSVDKSNICLIRLFVEWISLINIKPHIRGIHFLLSFKWPQIYGRLWKIISWHSFFYSFIHVFLNTYGNYYVLSIVLRARDTMINSCRISSWDHWAQWGRKTLIK